MQQQHAWSGHRHVWQCCCTVLCSTAVIRAVLQHPNPQLWPPPPLTAVWDPHTELLGGQRQPRAGHQQSPPPPTPSPHRGGGGHCKPAQDARQWVGCHEGGPLDPHVLQAGHHQSHSSHHSRVSHLPCPWTWQCCLSHPSTQSSLSALPSSADPVPHGTLQLCLSPTLASPSALTANSLSGSFGPFLKGRE